MKSECEKCGTVGAKRTYRLNPRNFKRDVKMLCSRCREELGYTVDGHATRPGTR